MPVITMTQEMATLGKDVALGVCEELGLEQVRHEIGDIVAGRMHVKKASFAVCGKARPILSSVGRPMKKPFQYLPPKKYSTLPSKAMC